MTIIRSGGVYAARAEVPGKYALWHIFRVGRAGRPRGWKISVGSADDQMKFSYLAVFPPGNSVGILGKTEGIPARGKDSPLRVTIQQMLNGNIIFSVGAGRFRR